MVNRGTISGLLLAWSVLLTSPVFGTRSGFDLQFKKDLVLIGGAAGSQIIGQIALSTMHPVDLTKPEITSPLPWDQPFKGSYSGSAALWSDILTVGILTPFALSALNQPDSVPMHFFWLRDGVMLAEALGFSSGMNLAVRSLQIWPRPLVYSSKASGKDKAAPEAAGSFYSGHSSASFCTAVFTSYVWQKRNPNSSLTPWIWSLSLSYASTIASLRVLAGKHYPSDVVVGALAGAFWGYLIPRLHLGENEDGIDMVFYPVILNHQGAGIGMDLHLNWGL